jgi:hypothetical protein
MISEMEHHKVLYLKGKISLAFRSGGVWQIQTLLAAHCGSDDYA